MRYQSYLSLVALALLSLTSTKTCWAKKNRDLPHVHSGLLKPYEAGPLDSVKLDKADEKLLDSGKPVMKQTPPSDDGAVAGGAICVQDVEAPREAVWSQILDFDSYKGKVPKVNESRNYVVKENPDGTHNIKTKMVVGVMPGYSVSKR